MGRIWTIRLALSISISVITLLFSFSMDGTTLLNYINTSFLIGLFLLIISGSSFVINLGFFDTFAKVTKKIFKKDDEYTDKTHWSYNENNKDEEDKHLRKNKKLEYLLYSPLFISFFLMAQSLLLVYFL